MKNNTNISFTIVLFLCLFGSHQNILSQDLKSASLDVQYLKENGNPILKISAKYREDRVFYPAVGLNLNIYRSIVINEKEELTGDSLFGSATTDDAGLATINLPKNQIKPLGNSFIVRIENSSEFEDDEESVLFADAKLTASIEREEDGNYITAQLTDSDDNPLSEQPLNISLKRLFGKMQVGEDESYETDEDGKISVAILDTLYSKSGTLNFEIKLDENDDYGTIVENLIGDFGVALASKDTFDKRTMWSPPSKTPLFALIVPNLLLIGIWFTLVLLVLNLFKIFKSK